MNSVRIALSTFLLASVLCSLLQAGPTSIQVPFGDQSTTLGWERPFESFFHVPFTQTINMPGGWETNATFSHTANEGNTSFPVAQKDEIVTIIPQAPFTMTLNTIYSPSEVSSGFANASISSTIPPGETVISTGKNFDQNGFYPEFIKFNYSYNSFLNSNQVDIQWEALPTNRANDILPRQITYTLGSDVFTGQMDWISATGTNSNAITHFPKSFSFPVADVFQAAYTVTAAPSGPGTRVLETWSDAAYPGQPVFSATIAQPSAGIEAYQNFQTYGPDGYKLTYGFEYGPIAGETGTQLYTATISSDGGWEEPLVFGFNGKSLESYSISRGFITETVQLDFEPQLSTILDIQKTNPENNETVDLLDATYDTSLSPNGLIVNNSFLYSPDNIRPFGSVTSNGATNLYHYDPTGEPLYHFVFNSFRRYPRMVIYLHDPSANMRGTLTIPTLLDSESVPAMEGLVFFIPDIDENNVPQYTHPISTATWRSNAGGKRFYANVYDTAENLVQLVEFSRLGLSSLSPGHHSAYTATVPILERRVATPGELNFLPPPDTYTATSQPPAEKKSSNFVIY